MVGKKSKNGSRVPWTTEEDEALMNAVAANKGKNWKCVAENLKGRSRAQCAHRWQKVLNPEIKKGAWSPEEDFLLKTALKIDGPGKWSRIAKVVPGRNGKQCRERWYNHLTPDVKKDPWSKEEDDLIINVRDVLGNRWAAIARLLPGRTENAVKNRWNAKLALDIEAGKKAMVAIPKASNKRTAPDDAESEQVVKKKKTFKNGASQKELSSQCSSLDFLANEAEKTKLMLKETVQKDLLDVSESSKPVIKAEEDPSLKKDWQKPYFSEGNFNKTSVEIEDTATKNQGIVTKIRDTSKLDWFASLSLAMGTKNMKHNPCHKL